jgi:hypothetical protein
MPTILRMDREAQEELLSFGQSYGPDLTLELQQWLRSTVGQFGAEHQPGRMAAPGQSLTRHAKLAVGHRAFGLPTKWSVSDAFRNFVYAFSRRKPAYELWLAERVFGEETLGFSVIMQALLSFDRILDEVVVIRLFDLPIPEARVLGSIPSPDQKLATVDSTGLEVDTPAWHELTLARSRLIDKKYESGLDEAERAELGRLQDLSSKVLERAFPRPRLSPEDLSLITKALGNVNKS